MPGTVAVALVVLAVIPLAVWSYRSNFLLHVAGADPQYIQTAPDRARYCSMGAIVLLTAVAATASLTLALTLVFPHHGWFWNLPVGLLWGGVVLNFDRWIVSSIDYGPLSATDAGPGPSQQRRSKAVQFAVRFTMAALVGLVISEPIVLAIFGPEITQQLNVQHATDLKARTAQIQAAEQRQLARLAGAVTAARKNLAAASGKANRAHKIYLCELTANCHLPPGEVTGVPGPGPQTTQDFVLWRQALRQQKVAQQAVNTAVARQRTKTAALDAAAKTQIAQASKVIDANNGLLARERALDTLTTENPGFFLRRLMVWLALMFFDLAPVLLKTFSPPTLYEVLQRGAAVRAGRNAVADAAADSDHESRKRAVTREYDLELQRTVTKITHERCLAGLRPVPLAVPGGGAPPGAREPGGGPVSARIPGPVGSAGDSGWVIGRRWHVQRPMPNVSASGRAPFVALDLDGEYPFEVVVKIIAPPPGAAGPRVLTERRHAQMEMSLPQGHIHDNIAEVLDCDLDPEYGSYLVTRLYPETLERYLAGSGDLDALTLGRVLRFAEQILDGLRAAWERGFVHLDLKPANVALTEDLMVKLIDFGLAQQYEKVNGGNDTTTVARFTPFYAPPEQMQRRDATWISRNADIRALGAVIYRMLTGHPPMYREARALGLVDPAGRWLSEDATAFFDIMALIESVEPVPVAELIGYLPADLDMLLRTWLRADPQMRCPGNPKTVAERVWLELAAVIERVNGSGEAGYPVGPRVTQEPDFAILQARWRRRARDEAAWLGVARDGTTLEGALPGAGQADGFADLAATVPGADRPRGDGVPWTGPHGAGPNGAGPGAAYADEEDTL
jgi:serine/threonine protein kinase